MKAQVSIVGGPLLCMSSVTPSSLATCLEPEFCQTPWNHEHPDVEVAAAYYVSCRNRRCRSRGNPIYLCPRCADDRFNRRCPWCRAFLPENALHPEDNFSIGFSHSKYTHSSGHHFSNSRFSSQHAQHPGFLGKGSQGIQEQSEQGPGRHDPRLGSAGVLGKGCKADSCQARVGKRTPGLGKGAQPRVVRKEVAVDPGSIGLVIGRGGETIQKLKHFPGIALVKVNAENRDAPFAGRISEKSVVVVEGASEEAVDAVIQEVQRLVNRYRVGCHRGNDHPRFILIDACSDAKLQMQSVTETFVDLRAFKPRDYFALCPATRPSASSFGRDPQLEELTKHLSKLEVGQAGTQNRAVLQLGALFFAGLREHRGKQWTTEELRGELAELKFQAQFSKYLKTEFSDRFVMPCLRDLGATSPCEVESGMVIRLTLERSQGTPHSGVWPDALVVSHFGSVDADTTSTPGLSIQGRTGRLLYSDTCFAQHRRPAIAFRLAVTSEKVCEHLREQIAGAIARMPSKMEENLGRDISLSVGEDTVRYVVKGYKKVEKEICSVKGYQLVFQKIQMWDEELNYDNHNGPICASELQVISEALDAALNRNDAGENSDTRFGVEGSGLGSFVPRTI
ncbi:unnamed protein product [Symbiodinium natans]|uniref:K Homology domain-containing protein n=1 Tax=Symbiodinium natans TaxID=878477 RepID=A0A812SXI1_9DINO|nr:unnamed protein product [Symbiodinium natans]